MVRPTEAVAWLGWPLYFLIAAASFLTVSDFVFGAKGKVRDPFAREKEVMARVTGGLLNKQSAADLGAIAAAIEEHKVRPADQWRLFARPH